MNVLGINIGHHSSVCLLQDGKIKYFIQEERFNREKHSPLPLKSYIELIQQFKIDVVAWGSPGKTEEKAHFEVILERIAFTYNKDTKFYNYTDRNHHKVHCASAFYNSGFKECMGLVVDGLGSAQVDNQDRYIGVEVESIFYCSYPNNITDVYKHIIAPQREVNLGRAYETITMHLGWDRNEGGKVMGLASYGKNNPIIPDFVYKHTSNPQVFYADLNKPGRYPPEPLPQTFIEEELNPQLKLTTDPREWYHNPSKITELEQDLAWQIQNDTQKAVAKLIEKGIKETGLKKVCCAGGYFLNCVANYSFQKQFPDVEFYFEPIAYDAGTAIGAAQLAYREISKDNNLYPQNSLYYGPQYSKKQLLEGIKKHVDIP
jgi:carbamoyltransferase